MCPSTRSTPLPRVILHVDMDAFYAAVEVRDNPALAGKPLIIGHRGPRGVVSTCSYEARRYGVHSAMPSVTAERLCPQAIWLNGRMHVYVDVSRKIRAIFDDFSPLVEPLSIDEAFLDLTGIARDMDGGRETARQIKERIRAEQQLSASVGVAPNKFLAKLASDMEKPDGLVVLPLDELPERLWMEPVQILWGVGPKMRDRLAEIGIYLVLDILKMPQAKLEQAIGPSMCAHLRALTRGEDDRPVEPGHDPKSISEERTYLTDLTDPDEIDRALLARSEGVARELRRKGFAGKTVHIKVRTGSFKTWTRAQTLPAPTDLTEVIVETARSLFDQRIKLGQAGVRLLGVGLSGLEPSGGGQTTLFSNPEEERRRQLAEAADAVRERLGPDALVRARLLKRRSETEENADDGEGSGESSSEGSGAASSRRTGRAVRRDHPGIPRKDGDDETPEASSLPAVD